MGRKPSAGRNSPPKPRRGLVGRVLRSLMLFVLVFGILGPAAVVLAYRFVPPPITWLMVQRMVEGRGFERHWIPLKSMSPHLVRSVIAAEDARFCEHHGFDFEAIRNAMATNSRGGKVRGGSTISQQTAKNVFLWPGRTWVRKALEAWITVYIEAIWDKKRILEVYLNVVEWGPGIYGAEAASRYHFHKSAGALDAREAALLATVLPSPLKWSASKPGPYVQRRADVILGRAAKLGAYAKCL